MLGNHTHFLIYLLLCALGIGIQIQILFGATDSYMGLRLNLGDFVLIFAGLFVLISLIMHKTFWPKWQSPCNDIWFYSLIGLILVGLINAYIQYGYISHWALLNRGIGWGILTGYIFFAGWIITNFTEKALLICMRAFLLFALITIICGTTWFFMVQLGSYYINRTETYIQFSGFMGNRNAFAFLMLCAVIFYTYFDAHKIMLIPKLQIFLTYVLWFCLPLAMIFNGSRAGWIGTGCIILWFLLSKFKYSLRMIIPALLLSSLIIGLMYKHDPQSVFREGQDRKISELVAHDLTAQTDKIRIIVAEDALELWSKHKIWGSGIGGFLEYQEEKRGELIDQIDNSALWVLTELGCVGAFVFGAFYIMALISLWRTYKTRQDIYGVSAQAMILVMILFALFSLVHQILYARYLWFLLGLTLARPDLFSSSEKSAQKLSKA